MIRFLLKGLLRDPSRSVFPFLIVLSGVMMTVVLKTLMSGVVSSLVQSTAHYSTGHVRVTTRGYAAEMDQVPNDLALLGTDTLLAQLRGTHPSMNWSPRIKFGGILDVPDSNRETRAQSPVAGLGVDLLSPDSPEVGFLNIRKAIVRGSVE